MVINENRRRFRKQRVAEDLAGVVPDSSVADTAADFDDRATLLAALRQLPSRQRAVVVLRFWLDMSEADTATALGCSVGTVKSQASRALAALRKDNAVAGFGLADCGRFPDDIIEGGLR
jgi:RNA polymerase sigma factor (sigma-70 family)